MNMKNGFGFEFLNWYYQLYRQYFLKVSIDIISSLGMILKVSIGMISSLGITFWNGSICFIISLGVMFSMSQFVSSAVRQ